MGEREVLGRRKEAFGDLVVCERNWAASHWITSFRLPCPHSSAYWVHTLLPWVKNLESRGKNAVAQYDSGVGSRKLCCQTVTPSVERMLIYIWKGSASPMNKFSPNRAGFKQDMQQDTPKYTMKLHKVFSWELVLPQIAFSHCQSHLRIDFLSLPYF